MNNDELKSTIADLIDQTKLGSLATVADGKPTVRYMIIHRGEGLQLYTTTFANSRKVGHIKENPHVHIAMGADPNNLEKPFVRIQATAAVLTDPETKKKCWCEMLGKYFSGPDDPNYAVIGITPQVVEYMTPAAQQPQVYVVNDE